MVHRRIRKVVSYVCTDCFTTWPDSAAAKRHWRQAHEVAKPRRGPGRPPKK